MKESITFDDFSNEVINAADRSLRTIYSINPTLREDYTLGMIEKNLIALKKRKMTLTKK